MGSLISMPLMIFMQRIGFELIVKPFLYIIEEVTKGRPKTQTNDKKKKRFDFFDLYKTDDVTKLGIISSEEQWKLELPSQEENEQVDIFGFNSWGQALKLSIDWRPQTPKTSEITVSFTFEDGKGNTYSMREQNLMPFDKTKREYKAPGVSLEILSPFRRLRIKFRGFLTKKGTNDLVFVKMRVLWIATSSVLDFECDHNPVFIENETKKTSKSVKFEEIKFENRFEQLGQMKGTVQFEAQNEENLFLWGNQSKTFEEIGENREIHRFFGYSKKGWVFHIGNVVDKNREISYRYGFAHWGKTFMFPVDSLSDFDLKTLLLKKESTLSLTVCGKVFDISIVKESTDDQFFQIKINGFEGRGVYTVENGFKYKEKIIENENYFPFISKTDALVLPIADENAEDVTISGGKGSSLSALNRLCAKLEGNINFDVPKGVVVTCNAYKLMIDNNKQIRDAIDSIKSVVSKTTDPLKKESLNVVNAFKSSQLPQEIKYQIQHNLRLMFGENVFENKSYAVRSSASGEDSEEMSAAGQMDTYLGIKGLDAIYSSVLKCWSSQFEFIAIEYKRGYGQDLNSSMAVIIQEMVDCDSAGVLFTCDPLTGNEKEITISGNYGIGESVVSAIAEPDTIRVGVKVKDNSFNGRTIEGIKSISIGSKSRAIRMDGSGRGTVEVESFDTNKCCLSPESTIRLAETALEIQKFFGSVRDIEWGVKEERIVILQSRPVTNLDYGFTEFELMHEFDIGLPSEKEYLTKANVGEVIPGCASILAITLNFRMWLPIMIRDLHEQTGLSLQFFCPFASQDMATVCYHAFLNLKNSEFLRLSNEASNYCKALILSIFGHELDQQIIDECKEITAPDPLKVRFWKNAGLIPFMIAPDHLIQRTNRLIAKDRYILDDKFESVGDMYSALLSKAMRMGEKCMTHIKMSETSSLCNYFLISILSEDKKNPNIFNDFAYLLSQCGQLESVDVPSALRQLAQSIEDPKLFKEMSDEKAIQYLKTANNKSSEQFKEFLSKHGHRGYKEFDPMIKTWRDDPIPVIHSLKTMLSGDASVYKAKETQSTAQIMDSLKTPLSYTRKLLLKYIFLPLAQRSVAGREATKSQAVYAFDIIRRGFWLLADRMHSEGLIPEPELMFLMSAEEIKDYIENRNPIIVWKAKQRKRLHTKMNNWKFDEIVSGYDFKPRELMDNNLPEISGTEGIKGTPVSFGKIMARVCVAPNLEDAVNIQPGDILVTYSTDIGWSPYFPMIGGIVTEIGGLISHGAVIAREYGLPCLVGANGACRTFKTGDMALLDCQLGIITRIDGNNNQQNGKT